MASVKEIKDFLSKLDITKSGNLTQDNSYVIDIDTYDEYGKFFSLLNQAENDEKLDQLDEGSIITIHTTDVSYITPEDQEPVFHINLLGDLDKDLYKLVVVSI